MILVTGATGFLGSFVVKKLLYAGLGPVRCFVRTTGNVEELKKQNVELAYGSFEDYQSFLTALQGIDTLINVTSLGFGHAPDIIKACAESGVRRGVFFSTTAVFTTLEAKTKEMRLNAEQFIKESSVNFTILRPTMIYGTPRDRNMYRLVRYLKKYPIIPVFGSGEYLQQPVYVEDLADAVVKVIENDITVNREYNLAGAEPLTYNQVIWETAKALGKPVRIIHIPVLPVLGMLKLYGMISNNPRLTPEQVLRLNEDKNFKIEEAKKDFGYNPMPFSEGIKREVQEIGNSSEGGISSNR